MKKNNFDVNEICPCTITIAMLSSKWKILIMRELLKGTERFGDLKRNVIGVSQKMLTQSLREMERDGLVNRKIYPEVPPRVEYKLTNVGESMRQIILMLDGWGTKYIEENDPEYIKERFNIDLTENSWMKAPDNEINIK
ncbi:winged helix-turn-helix transcriptional regulator [Companilactobacillus sp.]|jgi:DNA-binding HxlR family transcriptional regulator|uniref:winged helix-turn-helix transcriptional regulator n=1 Tax=Companilactobacillus sp. TaxID=2767905 RepID=UPI0025BE64CE|nr:helix-turn-helix domain-containing protein [Companilactobacillus sp.]MCH4008731.1 helix-turn-helix transcriptional regulator [Companilactobacillus sp.]MCH4051090.1 helix-turn-helix transcriptional regulator [Companilactobacillus sp.]MCH4076674.1 helix-turn-helix transcriptional regulator [Companilactobacillus sp.]MCH4125249.1 helix-turn-helix transcriptional regulator [Companilactobacillus sp.]MCH4131789.1 helix-turn-helix transcriptional regulator [Companilactobacillus sp.]